MEPEPELERRFSIGKSLSIIMSIDTNGMIIVFVAAIIAYALAFPNEHRSITRRPRIIRQPYINRDSLRIEIINNFNVGILFGYHPLPFEIQNNSRFFLWVEDFIEAIDGTHVPAIVSIEMQARFRGRKGETTQNVLSMVDFDLKFTYVLAGWEGSTHDSRVLGDALRRDLRFLKGIITLPMQDIVIAKDSCLRIEVCGTTRKSIPIIHQKVNKLFWVLDAEPYWPYVTQVDVVMLVVLHNYLRGEDLNDPIIREAELETES
ncbi:Glutamine--fructose-6-phosphate aminotransferase [isomerizing] [Bienertia sinuspersici]